MTRVGNAGARIELRGVSKAYPGGVEALAGLDLAVSEGEFLAIVGPSGSGKSTLLRTIAGLEPHGHGEIWIGGRRADGLAPHERGVAMVLQGQPPFPHLDVLENLAFGLRARHVSAREVHDRVEEAAARLGLTDLLRRRPRTLSGGERQRVALGRAMAKGAATLLLDEPLSDLDAPLRAALRDVLVDLRRRLGATIILVTHDQEEAMALGDRVAVMDRGRLVQVGTPREVYDRPASRFVAGFIGSPPMNLLPCEVVLAGDSVRLLLVGAGLDAVREVPRGTPWAAPLERRGAGPVELGLRPEHVVPGETAGGQAPAHGRAIVGQVRRLEPLGHETVATLAVGSVLVRTRLSARDPRRAGDLLPVHLDLAAAVWFDPRTGLLLP